MSEKTIQRQAALAVPIPVRLAVFFIGANMIGGTHMPFFPSWMESRGLDPSQIGLIMALMGAIRVFTGPFLSFAADASLRQRLVMKILAGVALISYVAYWGADGFFLILLWSLTSSAAWSALSPMMESMTLRASHEEGFQYGRVRLWGSAAYIVTNIGSGWVIAAFGIVAFLPMIVAAGAFTFAASFLLPAGARRDPSLPSHHRSQARIVWRLVRHPVFLLFLAAGATGQAQHGFYYGFSTLDWKAQGLSASVVGLLWAVGVIAEIILFWFSARVMGRINPAYLIAFSGACGIVRWGAFAFAPPLWALFPLQILHAGTFSGAHLAAMQFMLRAVPASLSATSQAVFGAVTYGIVMAGAQYASGRLFHSYGSLSYLAMVGLAAISLAFALWLSRAWDGKPLFPEHS
jgi:PPP family 3-phenylpropionic acid transporter